MGGFSLLELLIVISLFGLFVGAVYETVITGLRVVSATDDREEIRQELTHALERLTREASMARNVDRGQDDRFQFDADFDGSGGSSGTERNINYRYRSATDILERTHAGGSTVTLVSNLTSWDYNYVHSDGTEYNNCNATSSCSTQCCRADIRVVLITGTITLGTETVSMTSAVHLRRRL